MASKFWISGAPLVAQVDTLTPGGTIEAGDKFIITMANADGSKTQSLSVSATGTSVSQTCADITSAFNTAADGGAAAYSYFANITAANNTTNVTLTADVAGVPFTCTVSTTESNDDPADTQTFTQATSTANSGPNDWRPVANWSDGAIPGNSDTVIIDGRGSNNSILYGLNQSAVTLALLDVRPSFTGQIGTSTTRLRIGATLFRFGLSDQDSSSGASSTINNFNFGTAQTTAFVYGTKSTGSSGIAPLTLAGTHASNILTVSGASYVGVGTFTPAEATTFTTVINEGTGVVTLGTNLTHATVTNSGSGSIVTNSAVTTLKNSGTGFISTFGDLTIGTINARSGTIYLNNRKTGGDSITTLNLSGGDVDVTQDQRALTINATTKSPGTSGKILAATTTQVTHTDGALTYAEKIDGTITTGAD